MLFRSDFIIKEVIDKMTEMEENLQEQELIQDNNSKEDTHNAHLPPSQDVYLSRQEISCGSFFSLRDGTTCLSSNNVMRPAGQAARGFLSQNPAPVQKSGLRPGPLWDMDLRKRRFS